MPRRLAATFATVALVPVVVTWVVARTSASPAALVVLLLVSAGGAVAIGLAVSSRLSRSFVELQRRDRAVAVSASHELRTPITALRLSLEDLTLWPSTPADVSEELHRAIHELDRLSDAVTQLLDGHREDQVSGADQVDLSALTTDAVDAWRPHLGTGRQVHVDTSGEAPVRLDAGAVAQVLSVVLDQFTDAGSGDVGVEVDALGRTVRVRVGDQSPPRFTPGVIHGPHAGAGPGERLDLAGAGGLAEALGGYLAAEDRPTTSLVLILPAARLGTAG